MNWLCLALCLAVQIYCCRFVGGSFSCRACELPFRFFLGLPAFLLLSDICFYLFGGPIIKMDGFNRRKGFPRLFLPLNMMGIHHIFDN